MIKVRNLFKRYGQNQVLKGLHLDACQGEITVILGRSGVGKSVLLRHIIGLETPDQGTIEVDGTEIHKLRRHQMLEKVKNMGMLFQGSALFDSMTIFQNTAFYLKQHRVCSSCETRTRVLDALKMVGLEGTENKMPSDLSGGMRKRAALARLIVYRPSILLYDEPTTGLDPITSAQITDLIIQTQKELKGTSIVVTHDIHSALTMADKLALHRDGAIATLGNVETFLQFDDPIVDFIRQHISFRRKQDA
jgi:phospholipid/cholesterol/gamma-HCH transport system ATP-binding protein